MIKYIFIILSRLLNTMTDFEETRKSLRQEFSLIMFQLLIGVLSISIIFFSVVQLGNYYEVWLRQFENGFVIGIVSFSALVLIFSVVLYFLFFRSPFKGLLNRDELSKGLENDQVLENLALNFAEGFVEGFKKH
ncbi:MAG: hypothetical protein J0M15_09380 [Deltaproteobacteria bacterium]|nr:hypothetical protein [Deltaproteobacteria bacterium]